eukprot:scaffold71027_cov58-Cyclotella_meneghiniana.AAC.4
MTSSNNNSSTFDSILSLCRNHEGLPESELLSRLGPIVETNPDALQEKYSPNGRGFSRLETDFTLLHFAAANRSPQFCEILVNAKPDLLRNSDNGIGILPFHSTCMRKGRVETAKYLLSLYPESINFPARNPGGDYPIECVAIAFGGIDHDDNAIELVKFLLKHERALSTPSGYGPLEKYRVPRTAKVPRIRGTRGTRGIFAVLAVLSRYFFFPIAVISRYFRGIFSFRGTFAVNLTCSRYIRGTFAYTFGIKSLNNNTEVLDDVVHNVSRLFNTRQYNMFKAVKITSRQ